ncbi:gustatory receptor for sugar taste 64a-like isoform X2 [Nilaparvata lugens]|uniref:gustatory receptor for sugar taste 64a-like isoform X2 n=1 Tax=Nilaparvata lugens TaxID=108931 RepID=UPI00193D2FC0|nr:gustatory receptor for sugar taste 64a-like isoform X2 [Nilaparvata lugens]
MALFPVQVRIIFFGTSWISCALLRELAVHWPQLCRVWAKCEQTTNLGYPTNLTLKCHCFIFIYIMTAVCEHGLALSNAFSEAAACGDALRNLCTHWFPQVFNLVPFYRPLAIIIMTINTIATFTFNFVDLLLITTGYILANLLTQYNRVLEEDSHKIKLPSYYWTVKFQIYNDMISLANIVFGRVSKLLLLSFFISVSLICFQLYFNLTPVERSTVGKIYYVISLTYLVARCYLLCIVLGSVHEEGAKVKRFIHAIPSQSYTPVVERFLLHVNNQSSEFSAFGFFTVTRTTIITIMSIVLSYEAIMHQFKTLMIDVEDGQALKRNASIDCSKYLQLGD